MSFDSYATIEASPRPVNQTAQIREDAYCLACGWPVTFVYCNDGMARIAPYSEWNAWTYCTNKTCKHHDGEGVLHNMPSWIRSAAPNQPLAAPAHQRTGAAKSAASPPGSVEDNERRQREVERDWPKNTILITLK